MHCFITKKSLYLSIFLSFSLSAYLSLSFSLSESLSWTNIICQSLNDYKSYKNRQSKIGEKDESKRSNFVIGRKHFLRRPSGDLLIGETACSPLPAPCTRQARFAAVECSCYGCLPVKSNKTPGRKGQLRFNTWKGNKRWIVAELTERPRFRSGRGGGGVYMSLSRTLLWCMYYTAIYAHVYSGLRVFICIQLLRPDRHMYNQYMYINAYICLNFYQYIYIC